MRERNTIIILITAFLFGLISSGLGQTGKHINYDSVRIVLEQMLDADRKIRTILMDSVGINSPQAGKYLEQMATIDGANQQKIESLLDNYGWIEKSKIGVKASEAIFYIVQHSDLTFMEKYFPQFKKLAAVGEASPMLCAMMEDRLLMWKGRKQIYGSQASDVLRPNKTFAIWPIENPEEVNALRKKVGFPTTVEENAKRLNADYDPHEKLPAKR